MSHRSRVPLLVLLVAALLGLPGPAQAAAPPAGGRLLGVNRAGTEYACAQGWGIFDGPSDAASVAAIASWKVTAVRVPLNESCWLGINGVQPQYGGESYRSEIARFVGLLNAEGMTAVLDLHWVGPGTQLAGPQMQMADADHSTAFWASVAERFRNNSQVAFDLFNEPHDIDWPCWRDGCQVSAGYQSAGMQDLLDAVRGVGATTQLVIATGLAYGNDLTGWLANRPTDPAGKLAAGFHAYNFNACVSVSCWDATVAPVAAQVPVITGEISEDDCGTSFLDSYLPWADSNGISYLGWAWNTYDCAFPSLISNYDGTPTATGLALKNHLGGVTAPSSRRFGFESGRQGWVRQWGATATSLTSSPAFRGSQALQVKVVPTSYDAVGTRTGIASLTSGTRVTYAVFRPSTAPPLSVEPFVQDGAYEVRKAATTPLAPGWNTVSWTVPTVDRVTVLGLQVDNPNAWTGRVVLDEVRW